MKSHLNLGTFQVIAWRPPDWKIGLTGTWPEPRLPVYRWMLNLGPLEVRRFSKEVS